MASKTLHVSAALLPHQNGSTSPLRVPILRGKRCTIPSSQLGSFGGASCRRLHAPLAAPRHLPVAATGVTTGSDDIQEEASGLRRIGWISFWSQLALSIVSAIVLFFTANTASQGNFPKLPVFFNLGGVIAGFISTFLAYGKTRIARSVIVDGEKHSKSKVAAGLLGSTRLNLAGMGATIIGLQSTVGGLVGKSLTSSSTGPYNAAAASSSPAAIDVFAVQASTNTILLHFIAILFSNWALRILNKDAPEPAAA